MSVETLNLTSQDSTWYPSSVLSLFERWAKQTPSSMAVVDGEQVMSYGELDRSANQLARFLRRVGVRLGEIAGVCLPRSADLIVALLAILKCGAAYLPMDVNWPSAEKVFQVTDARVSVVITQSALQESFSIEDVVLILLDEECEQIARESIEAPGLLSPLEPGDLCYVMYTSGSTGVPKGVLIPHRGVLRLVYRVNYIEVRPGDRVACGSNPAFDASTFEIWAALLNGACLVILPEEVLLSPARLAHWIREQRISILFLTTKLFHLMSRVAPHAFATLDVLFFGGEAVDASAVQSVLRSAPPRHIINGYGPTECTACATWYECCGIAPDTTSIPIGYPVSKTTVRWMSSRSQFEPETLGKYIWAAMDWHWVI